MLSQKLNRPIALVGAALVVGAGAYGIVGAAAGNGSRAATTSSSSSGLPIGGGAGSNARSGPAAGGSIGTVGSVSKSSFTLTTSTGQRVTVKRVSATKYKKGGRWVSASAIARGKTVLALGTTNGTVITASQVIVQPKGSAGSATSSSTAVIPFQPGAPSTSKQVGQIPAAYSQGSGTIVSGTKADRATEAALAAYPGGIVDRVVKLSNGDYEVHNIGVNWPHHIFVNQNFKVVGAD